MYQSILVPIDGTDASHAALQHALSIAEPFDAAVHVITVVEPSGGGLGFASNDVAELDAAIQDLVEAAVAARERTTVEIQTEVRRAQTPYDGILAHSEAVDADLIVAGRHGSTSLPEAILGGTADRLARLSPVPVVLVPRPEESSD
ncbi:universal stress protein [Haloferax mediterranei ATCC 33500]|uniref:Stress response protein n=1 Tax=Haloferax mediterranei (strain ATCC 33500 / DSM 1411 / JCM 8866 / NBRC 14739 / NCIMB 2177 / R-4) TaxID=523841 RepID=I3R6I9_HALMT|nr:universal stress protein [Haloferax mediterranei]AFK19849.1 stress response protein [Haloferax mediterranei ATCC 33500]AHZ23233.1 stress response protein [Haloferax mediterranei ATCC 33500]ELZ99817.1 stress response protein [Haloferax mediterranei ATCC 33500]MDX5987401.1 universal stress protein [Haloferax mediterranei ATCC 33500]QCQ73907.1 universal stress protein [Haloferax mediterranei ATCC 33500]